MRRRNDLSGNLNTVPFSRNVAPFLYDTFTDVAATNLSAHTPEIGGAWSIVSGAGCSTLIDTSGIRCYLATLATQCIYRNACTPPGANYYVQAVMDVISKPAMTPMEFGIGIRFDTSAPASGYSFCLEYSSGVPFDGWRLDKWTPGLTNLSADAAVVLALGLHTIRLEVQGTTLRGYLDGVLVTTQTDASVSQIGAPTVVGFGGASGAAAGIHMSSIIAGTL